LAGAGYYTLYALLRLGLSSLSVNAILNRAIHARAARWRPIAARVDTFVTALLGAALTTALLLALQ
jgi:hypothetical protein